jgi:hypothetical protein
MGLMRFRVFPTERITEEMVQQAYLSGIDRVSWPVRITVENDQLIFQRAVSDSANAHIPWPVEGYGVPTLTSGTLMEQPEPYLLPVELARGVITQVRNQLSDWQLIGLAVPASVPPLLAEAVARLSWSVVSQDQPAVAAEHAEAALRAALGAGDLLANTYAEQALIVRRRNTGKLTSLLGADLGVTLLDDHTGRQFLACFDAAQVPVSWRDAESTEGHFSWSTTDKQIQWCRTHGLKVLAGPLLMLDPNALPDWLYLFADDLDSMLDCVSAFITEAVERYRGKVDYWVCAGRVNTSDVFPLSEHERLQLVAHAVERVRSLDPNTPVLVSFDQPWAEYMRQRESDLPPLHFADALLRAGLDLSGLMLEMNVGFSPGGTLLRHPIEVSRQLDTWSILGLPLWLSICAPSGHSEDLLAQCRTATPSSSWTPATQQAWVARNVPLSLVKPLVQGVIWNQLRDSQPHDFPHGGLFDDHRRAKPSLRTLAAIRQAYLK